MLQWPVFCETKLTVSATNLLLKRSAGGQEAQATEVFKAIGEAYLCLRDPEKRAAYDYNLDNKSGWSDWSADLCWQAVKTCNNRFRKCSAVDLGVLKALQFIAWLNSFPGVWLCEWWVQQVEYKLQREHGKNCNSRAPSDWCQLLGVSWSSSPEDEGFTFTMAKELCKTYQNNWTKPNQTTPSSQFQEAYTEGFLFVFHFCFGKFGKQDLFRETFGDDFTNRLERVASETSAAVAQRLGSRDGRSVLEGIEDRWKTVGRPVKNH